MKLEDIKPGMQIHHATFKQGPKKDQAYRVRVTSIKTWKRRDFIRIRLAHGLYEHEEIMGTKAEVEKELENWHVGFYDHNCSICK